MRKETSTNSYETIKSQDGINRIFTIKTYYSVYREVEKWSLMIRYSSRREGILAKIVAKDERFSTEKKALKYAEEIIKQHTN